MTSHCKLIGLFKQQEYIFLGDNYEAALLRVNWARDRAYAYDDDDGRDIEEYDFERYVSFRPDVSPCSYESRNSDKNHAILY